jgi:diguanylate cyclase (GGDEF)-like protein
MKNKKHLETKLEGIYNLLSHLHNEVTTLENSYSQVLLVLEKVESVYEVDELSGLLRKASFFDKWKELLRECEDLEENCGFLMIDIDHFKQVNDTYGHPTGDEVIRRVGELLKRFESPNCIVGRYGGEEFALAYRGSDAELRGLAELIRKNAEQLRGPVSMPSANTVAPSETKEGPKTHTDASDGTGNQLTNEWKCTLSVGVASAQKIGYDAPRLLKAADEALYDAKHAGRNCVRVSEFIIERRYTRVI